MAWNRRSCFINPETLTAERSVADAAEDDADRASPADEPSDDALEGPLAWRYSATATPSSTASTSAMRTPILTMWLVGEFTPTPMYHGRSASLPAAAHILGDLWTSAGTRI